MPFIELKLVIGTSVKRKYKDTICTSGLFLELKVVILYSHVQSSQKVFQTENIDLLLLPHRWNDAIFESAKLLLGEWKINSQKNLENQDPISEISTFEGWQLSSKGRR